MSGAFSLFFFHFRIEKISHRRLESAYVHILRTFNVCVDTSCEKCQFCNVNAKRWKVNFTHSMCSLNVMRFNQRFAFETFALCGCLSTKLIYACIKKHRSLTRSKKKNQTNSSQMFVYVMCVRWQPATTINLKLRTHLFDCDTFDQTIRIDTKWWHKTTLRASSFAFEF